MIIFYIASADPSTPSKEAAEQFIAYIKKLTEQQKELYNALNQIISILTEAQKISYDEIKRLTSQLKPMGNVQDLPYIGYYKENNADIIIWCVNKSNIRTKQDHIVIKGDNSPLNDIKMPIITEKMRYLAALSYIALANSKRSRLTTFDHDYTASHEKDGFNRITFSSGTGYLADKNPYYDQLDKLLFSQPMRARSAASAAAASSSPSPSPTRTEPSHLSPPDTSPELKSAADD